MFSKLALKNVTRSVRDYSVYFLTLMFGVCIFYVFNSLDSQWVMESLRGGLLAFWHCVNPSMASGVGLGWVGLGWRGSSRKART